MLLQFSVQNYLSFKDLTSISFQAGTIKEYKDNIFTTPNNPDNRILKSLAIYGANSSGKSNLLKAFAFMRQLILDSSKEKSATEEIEVESFRLHEETDGQSSTFEVIISLEHIKYRYGFVANKKQVESEWLFYTIKRKEEELFVRSENIYRLDKKFKLQCNGKAEIISEMTRPNSLYLSTLSQFNIDTALKISSWFNQSAVLFEEDIESLINFTSSLLSNPELKARIHNIIEKSELGFTSIEQMISDSAKKSIYSEKFLKMWFHDDLKNFTIKTKHVKYGANKKEQENVFFELKKNESMGTQKYIGLLGPIVIALTEKRLIMIDEIDSRFHQELLQLILTLFNSNKNNPWGAQLVCTCHNTYLLKKLRRDQMLLADKDQYGGTSILSLYDKDPKVRNDALFDKEYSMGKYGSIPKINTQLNIFED